MRCAVERRRGRVVQPRESCRAPYEAKEGCTDRLGGRSDVGPLPERLDLSNFLGIGCRGSLDVLVLVRRAEELVKAVAVARVESVLESLRSRPEAEKDAQDDLQREWEPGTCHMCCVEVSSRTTRVKGRCERTKGNLLERCTPKWRV